MLHAKRMTRMHKMARQLQHCHEGEDGDDVTHPEGTNAALSKSAIHSALAQGFHQAVAHSPRLGMCRASRVQSGCQLAFAGILKQRGEDCIKIYLAAAVLKSSLDMSEDAPLLKVGVLHSEGEIPPSRDRHLHRECSAAQLGLLLGGKLVEKELQEGPNHCSKVRA